MTVFLVGVALGCSSGSTASDGPPADTLLPPDSQTLSLSCADACNKILGLCPDIGSVWGDACTTSCKNKQTIKFELAKTETDCIQAAQDCTTATLCAKDLH